MSAIGIGARWGVDHGAMDLYNLGKAPEPTIGLQKHDLAPNIFMTPRMASGRLHVSRCCNSTFTVVHFTLLVAKNI